MNKHLLFLCIACVISTFTKAQNVAKAFGLLDEEKFEEAHAIIERSLEKGKDSVPAYYALSLLLLNERSIYSDIDSSYSAASLCELLYFKLEKKDKDRIFQKFQISGAKISALRHNITVDAFRQVGCDDEAALRRFVAKYGRERASSKARECLLQVELEKSFSNDKPVEYYIDIIDRFPTRDIATRAWQRLYELMTGDGEFLSMDLFLRRFSDFPLDTLAKRDIELIKKLKLHRCNENITMANEQACREYIKAAAPKHTAFVALQGVLKRDIDSQNWSKVKQVLSEFEPYFGASENFKQLQTTVNRGDFPGERKNIGSPVNSPNGHEYSPVISASGQNLYFCGMKRADNLGGEDIFVSAANGNGTWGKPELIPLISTKLGNEAPEAVSTDETKMILYYNGDIFSSTKTRSGWTEMREVKGINTQGWDGDAVLSADGKAIIFASEGWRKEGVQYPSKERKQGFDIYVSVKGRGGWSTPMNMGTKINTPWCDRYPFLHPDGKTLYFSSEGHGSLGGSDVFRTVRLNDTTWNEWSEPENLGKYINTTGEDNGYKISTDGLLAYYSVNNGKHIDIFTTEIPEMMRPEKVAVISGTLTDENGNPVEGDITVENLSTGKEIAVFSSDPSTGRYVIVLPMKKNYGFYVQRNGCYPASYNIDLTNESRKVSLRKDISLPSLKSVSASGQSIVINNIFFDTDEFDLKPSSFLELERLAKVLHLYKEYNVVVEGHTDNDGTAEHNQMLSDNRARAVVNYLVKTGIQPARLSSSGYGSTRPLNNNESMLQKQQNRRVEVRFVSK